ncbi:MAG: hypothetical protein IPP71_19015 [Bacteroidetes bacterium]|nr:hypothetical protein [Bacteroidota bacterium]
MKLKTISLIAFALLAICLRAKSQVNDYLNNDPVWKINSTCGIPAPCIKYDDYNFCQWRHPD